MNQNQYQPTRSPRILLVEDNPGDVLLIRECFRAIGKPYDLSVARDGEEALDFLKRTGQHTEALRPDLVLLDLNLPKLSGHEVLAFVKGSREFQKIPVLVLSTSHAPGDIQKAYALAANCYICKPSSWDEFQHVIQTLHDFWLELVWFPTHGKALPAHLVFEPVI